MKQIKQFFLEDESPTLRRLWESIYKANSIIYGSSCPAVFFKKGIFRYFAKFTGELTGVSFLTMLQTSSLLFYLKKLRQRCLSETYVKFIRTTYF